MIETGKPFSILRMLVCPAYKSGCFLDTLSKMEGPLLRDVFFLSNWKLAAVFFVWKKIVSNLSDWLCPNMLFWRPLFFLEASRVQRGIFHWKKNHHQKPSDGRQEPLQVRGTQWKRFQQRQPEVDKEKYVKDGFLCIWNDGWIIFMIKSAP